MSAAWCVLYDVSCMGGTPALSYNIIIIYIYIRQDLTSVDQEKLESFAREVVELFSQEVRRLYADHGGIFGVDIPEDFWKRRPQALTSFDIPYICRKRVKMMKKMKRKGTRRSHEPECTRKSLPRTLADDCGINSCQRQRLTRHDLRRDARRQTNVTGLLSTTRVNDSTLCYAMRCYAMLRYTTLCNAMPRYASLLYAMLR